MRYRAPGLVGKPEGAYTGGMREGLYDPSMPHPDKRLEDLARYIAGNSKPVSVVAASRVIKCKTHTAAKHLQDPRLIDRVTFLVRYRLKGAIPKALKTLEDLMDSKHDSVRLRAAIELLDRAGLSSESQVQQPAFTVELNLSGLKTATSLEPPPKQEEFLDFSAAEEAEVVGEGATRGDKAQRPN